MPLTPEQLFLMPFLLHFAVVCGLYSWLTWARVTAMLKREVRVSAFVEAGADPARSKRVSRNLSNQFEAPVFVVFAALFLYFSHRITAIDIGAAWLFLAGRLIHTAVQTLSDNIPLRGLVFTINFAAVIILMVRVAWVVFA